MVRDFKICTEFREKGIITFEYLQDCSLEYMRRTLKGE